MTANPQERLLAAVSEIETTYLNADSVDHHVPLQDRLQAFDHAIRQDKASFDAANWRDEFVPVAQAVETDGLSSAVGAIAESQDELVAHGVATSVSILLDCLIQLPETPVGSAVESLVNAGGSDSRDQLATAIETTSAVARSTATCRWCIDATKELTFYHPDASTEAVQEAVYAAHRAGDIERVAGLVGAVERSKAGEWTEEDLRGYADDQKSGEPFERLLANLWLDSGYDEAVVIDDAGGDGGVDVVATTGDRTVGIEAKRYDERTLRVQQVRRLAGVLPQYDFDQVYLVTSTTDVTDDALTEASRVNKLQLVTGETLADHLSESSLVPPVFVE